MSVHRGEAWVAGRLSHPNIVRVHGQGASGDARYIVMELVRGPSLQAVIRDAASTRTAPTRASEESARIRRVVELFLGVADALGYVHAQGIVHRDVKPGNLLLTEDRSRLLLTDFGLAKEVDASRVTRRGDLLGTICYMAPEQLLAQRVPVDHRCDIYSLGVSLYEALTSSLPWPGESEEAYLAAASTTDPIPARSRRRSIPRDLETILLKCLARDPARRYPSATELREDLQRFLDDRPVLARRPGLASRALRWTRRHRLAAASAVLAAMLSTAGALWLQRRAEDQAVLERIRFALEESIDRGVAPQTLQPDWARLEARLAAEVAADPDAPLALLARRAACTVRLEAPSFALLSRPPELSLRVGVGFIGEEIIQALCSADIEASWDGGSPRRIVGALWYNDGLFIDNESLDEWLEGEVLSAGPHELDVRVTSRVLDPPNGQRVQDRMCRKMTVADCSPEASKLPVLWEEQRSLDPLSIQLFDAFPAGFPRLVADAELRTPMRESVRIERARLIVIDPPPGLASGLVVDDPAFDRVELCKSERPHAEGDWVVGLHLFGRISREPPVPLAADVELHLDGLDGAIPIAPLAVGRGVLFSRGFMPQDIALLRWDEGSTGTLERLTVFASAASIPKRFTGGTQTARVRFVPSRAVALETQRFVQYYGEELSFPVSLEIVRGDAEEADLDCGR